MMKFPSPVVGIVTAGALLMILGLTRLLVPHVEVAELEIREVEISSLPEPPPPPPEEPPPDTPPPPSLTDVSNVPDPTRVPVPKVEVPLDLTLPVDPFFTDIEPAPLPKPKQIVRHTPQKPAVKKPIKKREIVRKPPPPVKKSHYGVGELDGRPRLLSHGSASFPTSLARKGVTSGTVLFEVELSTSGRVKIRRVIRSSHPELVSAARRVASSARFTPPTKNGQRVKAVMRWPIKIKQ